MTDQRFRREYRLRSRLDFDRVFARRCSAGDAVLVVYAAPADVACEHPRLGLVVSRKAGNAVRRNRWKRLIREAFRLHRLELPPGVDLVVLPRADATPTLATVARALTSLARRAARRLSPPPRTDPRRTEPRQSDSRESNSRESDSHP